MTREEVRIVQRLEWPLFHVRFGATLPVQSYGLSTLPDTDTDTNTETDKL